MISSILVAIDGSEHSERALKLAIDMSRAHEAKLSVVHVHLHGRPAEELARIARFNHGGEPIEPHGVLPPKSGVSFDILDMMDHAPETAVAVTRFGDQLLAAARELARGSGLTEIETHIRTGDYADGILDVVDDESPDLVVIGRRGLGRAQQLILGSVSNKVAQHTTCNILLVR